MSVVMASGSVHTLVGISDYGQLIILLRNSIIAGAVLGVTGGLISVFVIARDMPFAVHGISEISFAGAAGALLFAGNIVAGSFVGAITAAVILGLLGMKSHEHNSVLGVLVPFGLGLGILFLALSKGRAANKFGLLTGQIVAVDNRSVTTLCVTAVVVTGVLLWIWRPLMFASVDPDVAVASGVPVRFLAMLFMVLLACTVAISVQIVGALLMLALLCTPAAAAQKLTSSPLKMPILAVLFALISMVGGTLFALGTTIPVSPFVTTVSFVIYLLCRAVQWERGRVGHRTSAKNV